MINELKAQRALDGGLSDEFVELFNTCQVSFTFNVGTLEKHFPGGAITTLADLSGLTIAGNGFFLIAGQEYSGTQPSDALFTSADVIPAFGGGLMITAGAGVIDAVCWGNGATTGACEGQGLQALFGNSSFARTPNGNDTNNNFRDFVTSVATPRAAN